MAKKKKVYTSMITFHGSRGQKKGMGSYESKKKDSEEKEKPKKK